jgi:hypothetical protein
MKIKSLQFYDYRVFYADLQTDKKDYFIEVDGKKSFAVWRKRQRKNFFV